MQFSKQISYAHISAPRRDNPSKLSLRGRPESQLWRRHQNLYLLANQDDLTPGRFYYSRFITELQRFFCHIGNHGNRNVFEDLTFPIGFTLKITWSFLSYDHMIWLEHMCCCSTPCTSKPRLWSSLRSLNGRKNEIFTWIRILRAKTTYHTPTSLIQCFKFAGSVWNVQISGLPLGWPQWHPLHPQGEAALAANSFYP